MLASQGATIFLRLISTILLTRLLAPEAFGEILVVSTITGLITLCSEIGLRGSIINSNRGLADAAYVNTVWTLRILQYGLVGAVLLAASLFIHHIYPGISNIDEYLRICALTALLTGLASTKVFQQEKQLRPARPAAILLLERLISLLTAILLCSLWPDASSVLWANAIAVTGTVILSHKVLPGVTNRIHIDRAALHSIFNYGKWMLPATIVTWGIRDGYKLGISFILLPGLLGFFAIASNIGLVLATVLREFSEKWLFPVYCQNKGSANNEALSAKIRLGIFAVSAIFILALSSLSGPLVRLLYTPEFSTVADFLAVVVLGSGGLIVTALYLPVLKAHADSRRVFLVRLIQLGTISVGMFLGYLYGNSAYIIGGTAFGQLAAGLATVAVALPYFNRKTMLLDGVIFSVPMILLLPGYISELAVSLSTHG